MNYTQSKNDIVNEYLEALDPGIAPLFHAVRDCVLKAGPGLNESIKWRNCLVYATTRNLIQTVVGKGKVSLVFSKALHLRTNTDCWKGMAAKCVPCASHLRSSTARR